MDPDVIFRYALGILFALGALGYIVAIMSPFLVLAGPSRYAAETISCARKHLGLSLFILGALLLHLAKIVLVYDWAEALELALVGLAGLLLALFSFRLKPDLLARMAGCFGLFFCLPLTIFLLLVTCDPSSMVIKAEMGAGRYCSKESWGFSFTDGGDTFDVFDRYGPFARRIFTLTVTDDDPGWRKRIAPADLSLLDSCDRALDREYSNRGQGARTVSGK